MSVFPYSQVSPPPTAGPLSIVDRANQVTPYSGGGGGGPSTIGPNPSVSTISFPVGNKTTAGVVNISSCLSFVDNSAGNPAAINLYPSGDTTTYIAQLGAGPGNFIQINPTIPTGGIELLIGTSDQNTAVIGSLDTTNINPSTLTIIADRVKIPNADLQVSSINGAAPVGGSGPNPSVSSLTLPSYNSPSTGSIAFTGGMAITEASSGSFPEYFFDAQKATTGIYGLVSTFASSITTFNISQPFADSTSLCLAAGDNGNAIIFTTAPTSTLALVADPVVIPGNLVVSSINGAAPVGGSAPFFSTLFTGTSSINCDGGATQVLLPFDTIAGHLYQIQTQMSVQPRAGATQTPGAGDYVLQEVLGQVYMNQTQGDAIVAADAASADIKIGCLSMFKSTGGPNQLDIIGSFSTTIDMAYVGLVDFGAV